MSLHPPNQRSHPLHLTSSLCLIFLIFLLSSPSTLTPTHAQWFTDPCQYHPHALHQLRLRFESIVGQQYATDTMYAHLQRHIETYDATRSYHRSSSSASNEDSLLHTPNKPLVLSLHGPTGTGKSLTANSIASALFFNARSTHIHTYHGADFSGSSPHQVEESITYLKHEFASHVRRCSLSLFIIEEIHLMAPGVLDGLKHLMDVQAPNSRFKVSTQDGGKHSSKPNQVASGQTNPSAASAEVDENGRIRDDVDTRTSDSSASSSISLNFAHVIWLFTTNIGSSQVQKIAYDAAKSGLPREAISPTQLHDILLASLEYNEQLQLLRDSSVLSGLIPFFPLFKMHVKECTEVQLQFRRKHWLQSGQLQELEWDQSIPSYVSSQLKYNGPISIYGCKNIHELLTSLILSPLTRRFRKEQEEADYELQEMMRDSRVSKRKKVWSWSKNLLAHATQLFSGTTWNFGKTNVTMTIEKVKEGAGGGASDGSVAVNNAQQHNIGKDEIVFQLTQQGFDSTTGLPALQQSEIRHVLHTTGTQYHTVQETHQPHRHDHIVDTGSTVSEVEDGGKEDL